MGGEADEARRGESDAVRGVDTAGGIVRLPAGGPSRFGSRGGHGDVTSDAVVIDVDDAVAGVDLVQSLGRHGLNAGLVRTGSRWQVEVRSLGEDPRSFFADLGMALAAWGGPGDGDGGTAIRRRTA